MKIKVFYPFTLATGLNYAELNPITNFEEKSYGISFFYEDIYTFIPYSHIMSFALMEE